MDSKILFIIGGILLLLAATVTAVAGGAALTGSSTERVVCSGNVEVDPLGIGAPDLDPPPQCVAEPCGFFSFTSSALSWTDALSDEGNVELVVDGVLYDRKNFKSIGFDVDFTLKSECLEDPRTAEVILRAQGKNPVTHTEELI